MTIALLIAIPASGWLLHVALGHTGHVFGRTVR